MSSSTPKKSYPPTPLPTHLYKIIPISSSSSSEPTLQLNTLPKTLPLSDLDAKDKFIHLSTSSQVPATASRFFAEEKKLILLVFRTDTFSSPSPSPPTQPDSQNPNTHIHENEDGNEVVETELLWEIAPGVKEPNNVFPHLYNGNTGIRGRDVLRVDEYTRKEGEDWIGVLGGLEP